MGLCESYVTYTIFQHSFSIYVLLYKLFIQISKSWVKHNIIAKSKHHIQFFFLKRRLMGRKWYIRSNHSRTVYGEQNMFQIPSIVDIIPETNIPSLAELEEYLCRCLLFCKQIWTIFIQSHTYIYANIFNIQLSVDCVNKVVQFRQQTEKQINILFWWKNIETKWKSLFTL